MIELKNQTLLVIAPHPDDEVLGCGGLIAKIKDEGGKVYIHFLTVGATQDFSKNGLSTSEKRIEEINRVIQHFNIDGWSIAFKGNQYHLQLDMVPQKDLIASIETGTFSIEKLQPTIIVTTQLSDYNQDHRACAQAVIAATRPAPPTFKHKVPIVLGSEFTANDGWGLDPFLSRNFYVELSENHIQSKEHAMSLYDSQTREPAHTRSIENIRNLARIRGAQCGTRFAESFHVYRTII